MKVTLWLFESFIVKSMLLNCIPTNYILCLHLRINADSNVWSGVDCGCAEASSSVGWPDFGGDALLLAEPYLTRYRVCHVFWKGCTSSRGSYGMACGCRSKLMLINAQWYIDGANVTSYSFISSTVRRPTLQQNNFRSHIVRIHLSWFEEAHVNILHSPRFSERSPIWRIRNIIERKLRNYESSVDTKSSVVWISACLRQDTSRGRGLSTGIDTVRSEYDTNRSGIDQYIINTNWNSIILNDQMFLPNLIIKITSLCGVVIPCVSCSIFSF